MGSTAKRLVAPDMTEVSGVDWPAHLAPGWLVLKEIGDAEVEAALEAQMGGAQVTPEEAQKAEEAKKAAEAAATKKAEDLTPEERVAKAEADAKAALDRATKAEAERDEAVAKAAGKSEPEIAFEKALGTLPEPIQKAITDLQDRVEKAEKVATTERDARVSGEYLTKAADFDALPTTPEAMAKTLRAVDEHLDPAVAKELQQLLASANTVAKRSVLSEHGGSGRATSALEGLNTEAAEIRKSDPKLTPAQAFNKAIDTKPELAAAYEAEINGGGR